MQIKLKTLKYLLVFSLTLTSTFHLEAQNIEDALRYSFLQQQGTARSTAIGGAMGALGADFTAVSINPAGIGAFWKSEISFTPSLLLTNSDAVLNGTSNAENENGFGLGSLGVVFTNEGRAGGNWRTMSFGLSMNKMALYNNNTLLRGTTQGSITDRWVARADNLTPDELDDFETGIAYEAGAIFDFDQDLLYDTDFQGFEDIAFEKEQNIDETGAYNDINISLGANFKNKLLIGAAIGVPFLNYNSEKIYQEIDPDDAIPFFDNLRYRENLEVNGAGVNFKLGAIYKLNQSIRLGAAIHSPTYLSMTESFTSDVGYTFTEDGNQEQFLALSPTGNFEYTLTTPWRATGSFSYLLGRKGFVSADVEFVDYASAKFNFTADSDNPDDLAYQREVNADIKLNYSSALNLRVGGEFAAGIFRARAGIQLLGSPFRDDNSLQQIYAIGGGIRGNKAFLDLSFSFLQDDEVYSPYQVSGAPLQLVDIKTMRGRVAMTVGFKI